MYGMANFTNPLSRARSCRYGLFGKISVCLNSYFPLFVGAVRCSMDEMAQNLEQLDKGWHSERPESVKRFSAAK
jgi:hypothetical protein